MMFLVVLTSKSFSLTALAIIGNQNSMMSAKLIILFRMVTFSLSEKGRLRPNLLEN